MKKVEKNPRKSAWPEKWSELFAAAKCEVNPDLCGLMDAFMIEQATRSVVGVAASRPPPLEPNSIIFDTESAWNFVRMLVNTGGGSIIIFQ